MSLLFSSSLHLLPSSTPATSICYQAHPRIAAFSSSPPAGGFFSVSATSLSHFLDDNFRSGSLYCSSSSSMSLEESTSTSQLEDSLLYSRAFWVSRYVIAWNVEVGSGSCYLFASKMATLRIEDGVVEGYDVKLKLEKDRGRLPENVIKKFPHIQNYCPFTVPLASDVEALLKCQLAVATFNSYGECNNITCLQLPGVLDDLFSYEGPLGAVYSKEAVSLYLWAPTAQAVRAQIFRDPVGGTPFEVIQLEELDGVWRTKGPKSWEGCYYEYEVTVYHPSTLQIEKCFTTDPYSRGISSDGRRTLFVDIGSNDLIPKGWDKLADEKHPVDSFSDISIYELHVRDFSISDQSVHPDLRGGFMAFTLQDSAGINHLKKLSNAGISHVHLLPTFQFGGVDDDKTKWKFFDTELLEDLPPDSAEQESLIADILNSDGYNWGYNPILWGVPKGSYASDPNGPCRVIEFRKMVQALNQIGLRVVLDVVYNHLHGHGPFDPNSVLDKIVPGYYLRRNADGFIENSTCVNNTASEHFMVERMIVDDILHWVVDYKVDGFRFDLMGHLMKSTMLKAKDALQGLTKEKNGVDGSSIYIYGEGWDFGEVAKNGRGVNASQFNLFGTGIGSFNDRVRDAILGGSPFGHPLQQGFVTGLLLEPNDHDHGTDKVAESMLAVSKDHIEVAMAANLRDYVLTNFEGQEVKGLEVLTHDGSPVAYASCPSETVNYVSAHDNETLFDIVSLKTPRNIAVDDRCRINHLATSIIALSQGIPFFHCGDELLRSKSMDRDSYNSGDWFNRLDFTYTTNNWGVGLPPKEKNEYNWPLIKPRLADPSFKPSKTHILAAVENCTNLLQIRYSSPLFRLKTSNAIQRRVRFHNSGASLIPGLIVMSIEDGHEGIPGLSQLDSIYSYIVVVVNARPTEISFPCPALRARTLQLHPIQLMSTDPIVKNSTYEPSTGCFMVPPRTTAVFVEPRIYE
ncbi:pullulanase 1, chloroplastic [Benincasa hispida]|uniref:pullulanase 1, chloroplastic n=1 Tax=Benincasa hispida TaxID=102211 RepID=UPI00190090F8|nr:pullulanase 1, chloroplastic [Benincasa hispida]XP_038892370.1 pullulanase 1, chloroplastic [Benincasa hispida]